jgi:hypothetical protein
LEREKYFPYLVGVSALFIAGCAAFYSVFGLSKLFAGATLSVIIMAASLESGKLVAASFLYRYWAKINSLMKAYMTVGVITLVVITSAGIFGFLSNAYQGATIEFEKQSTTLLYKEERLVQLEEDKVYLIEELEQSITSLPDNYPTAKRKLREEYNPKILELNDVMLNIKQEIGELKVQLVETGVGVGPAIYLARTFETDIDTVVKFFIFILIFVFDPMAVSLIIAYNVIISNREVKRKKKVIDTNKEDIYIRKEMTNDKEELKEEVEVVEEKVDTKPTEVPVKRIFHGGGGRTP